MLEWGVIYKSPGINFYVAVEMSDQDYDEKLYIPYTDDRDSS